MYAPSKTFNVAGLQLSNIIISNQKLREKFKHEVMQAGYSQPNLNGNGRVRLLMKRRRMVGRVTCISSGKCGLCPGLSETGDSENQSY